MESERELQRRAMMKLFQQGLSRAWERWQEWYALLKEQQFKLAGALRRMMNRQLSMGMCLRTIAMLACDGVAPIDSR